MIKIKDLIINENEIVYIEEFDAESLGIMFKGKDKAIFVDAHPEDIEWDYENIISESLSYDLAKARIKELEEKNRDFEIVRKNCIEALEEVKNLEGELKIVKNICYNKAQRINKAIEYINDDLKDYQTISSGSANDLLKILKGEENE